MNFTARIPRSLAEKMKRYSEVVRKGIEKYIEMLEEAKTRESRENYLRGLEAVELQVSYR